MEIAAPSLLAKPTVIGAADAGALLAGELLAEAEGPELPQAARPATHKAAVGSTVSIRPRRVVMSTAAPVVRGNPTLGLAGPVPVSVGKPSGAAFTHGRGSGLKEVSGSTLTLVGDANLVRSPASIGIR